MKRINFNYKDIIKILLNAIYNIPLLIIVSIRLFFKGGEAVRVISRENNQYRDLNKNGKIDIYEDSDFSAKERAEDLLIKMTLQEKVGQMFHPPISVQGGLVSSLMNLVSGKGVSTKSLIFVRFP